MVWMDAIRGVCILLVVILHATVIVEQHGIASPTWIWVFNDFFDPYRMTTLMFLSGMLLHKSVKKPPLPYLWGKFAGIYWPFLIWSTVTLATTDLWTWTRFFQMPISSPTFLWYLWFLAAYYVLALIIHRLRLPILPIIAVCLVGAELAPSLLRMDRFCALFVFFMAGHLVSTHLEWVQRSATTPVALVGLGLALLGAWLSVSGVSVKYVSWMVWAAAGMLTFLMWAVQFYQPHKLWSPVQWVGRNSLVFYVTHMSVMYLCADLLGWVGVTSFTLTLVLIVSVGLLVATLLTVGRARLPVIAALFDFPVTPAIFRTPPKVP